MMKKHLLAAALMVSLCVPGFTQTIEPVWEYLITGDSSPLPILEKDEPSPGETFDGTDIYDSYGGFKRYDDSRLLLGVRENGINESDPAHDAGLAAQFPDRSLIWIDPATGAPLGVALEVGLTPVPLDADLAAAGGTEVDYYFAFGVGDDGVIYTGHKNQLIKYEPNADGSFSDPIVIYVHPDNADGNWPAWRWETFKVEGAGTDTVIFAGGKTWRVGQKYFYFTTADGNTFAPTTDLVDFRGGGSTPYLNEAGDELFVIGGNFPGGASGFGVNTRRLFTTPGAPEPFLADDLFTFTAPAIDLEAQNFLDTYIGWFTNAYEAKTGLPYFAVYSSPSWDTKDPGTAGSLGFGEDAENTPYLPGWLALHDAVTGEYLEGSSRMLDVREIDELDGDSVGSPQPAARWHSNLGDIELNILPSAADGAAELLWYSGVYGYGRYAIGDLGEPASVPEWSLF